LKKFSKGVKDEKSKGLPLIINFITSNKDLNTNLLLTLDTKTGVSKKLGIENEISRVKPPKIQFAWAGSLIIATFFIDHL
jgi:hypothetical protein